MIPYKGRMLFVHGWGVEIVEGGVIILAAVGESILSLMPNITARQRYMLSKRHYCLL